MDGKRPSHEDHGEASFPLPRPPKRQKSSQDDWGNGIYKSQNALPTSHDQYTIAWICALHIEMAAACAMLDEIHETLPTHADDSNAYILGNIKQHNVVVACLPEGRYGLNNAANVLTHLVRTFPSIRAGLMVGIGGGVPSKVDLRLGDIVVGTRVMQYDLGKIVGDGQMQHTAIPKIPQQLLGTAVASLRARHEREGSRIPSILREKFEEHSEYRRPASPDCLFLSTYDHVSQTSACDECDHSKLVLRHIRETDDPLIHYVVLPYAQNRKFVGRERFFEDLLSRFRIGESYHARLALFGLGGVGKSQIALEYAYRFRAQHSNASIFWIHAGNRNRMEQGFNSVAEEIGIPRNLYPSTSIFALVRSWLSKRLRGPWLMVLDNADDSDVFFGKLTNEFNSHSTPQHDCLWDFLPQSPNSAILFTTRNKRLGLDLAGGGDLISVPPMKYSEAKLLFTSRLQTTQASEKSMERLFVLLEYLPLAIAQAAAVIERKSLSLNQYLERYEETEWPPSIS
ncbi:Nucleoside phosphorylase superfamily [Fusarium oxysporum f. sp. vasinfectum]|nr:Nucleoside phosphorylase superfamily [Fusarium oxysporum f. sp. vasinfectum]